MELRRALLLFAVVLGLAAIASSLNRPAEDEGREEPRQAEDATIEGTDSREAVERGGERRERDAGAAAESGAGIETIRFKAGGRAPERRLEAGSAATVLVTVEEPSQVRIEELGLIQPADALTPARFDVLVERETTSEVVVAPAGGGPSEAVGTLVVGSSR